MKITLKAWFTALAIIPLGAAASPITGVLNVTTEADLSSASGIAFVGSSFSVNGGPSSQTGGFVLLEGTTGTIKNLTNPPDAVGVLSVLDFLTFSAAPNITITLTYLAPGIDGSAGCAASPPAAGQLCTPSGSPANLQNLSSTSSVLTFSIDGVEVDSTTHDTVPVIGSFSALFTTESYQSVLADIGGGGTVPASFGAQFSTVGTIATVPEPSTLAGSMIAMGVIAIGLIRRKRFNKL